MVCLPRALSAIANRKFDRTVNFPVGKGAQKVHPSPARARPQKTFAFFPSSIVIESVKSKKSISTRWTPLKRFVLFNPLFLLAVPACLAAGLWGDEALPRPAVRSDRTAEVVGRLATSPERVEGLVYFELQPERVSQLDRPVDFAGRIAVFVYSGNEDLPPLLEPPLGYGERIRLRSFLTEPSHFAIPGVDDFRLVQWRRGVAAVIRLKSLDQIERTGQRGGNPLLAPLLAYGEAFRRFCGERFEAPRRTLILSAFLGERRGLEESERERIRRLGAYHLFVVSGFHVSLALAAFHWALGRFGGWGRGVVLAATWGYVLLSGASPSGVRAGLMTSFFYLLWGAGLARGFLNGLGLAALVMLAVNPRQVFQPGFQFSYLSLAAIGLFAAPWGGWLNSVRRGFGDVWTPRLCLDRDADGGRVRRIRFFLEEHAEFLPRRLAGPVLRRTGAVAAGVVGLVVCNLWIQLLTFPLTLRYSNRLVWTQCLANLVLVPLFSVFVPLCLVLFLSFTTALAAPVSAVAGIAAGGLLELMKGLESWSATTWTRHPGAAATVGHVFLLPVLTACLRGRWKWIAFCAPLLYLAWARLDSPAPSRWLTVTMLDVGQGESLHLRYPNGLDALVDTGGLRAPSGSGEGFVGERLVGRYLWEEGARRLEFVLLSHPHVDHIQGFQFLRRVFPMSALHYFQWDDSYRGAPAVALERGDSLVVGGVGHRLLHPPGDDGGWSVNDASLVMLVRYGGFSMLLTGDIERRAEAALLERIGPVTVLKVAHHGGATSSTSEFLSALRPQAALISAGRRNLFGHPARQTLQRLVAAGTPIFTTAESGTLRIETDGALWRLSRYSAREGRFVPVLSGPAADGSAKRESSSGK